MLVGLEREREGAFALSFFEKVGQFREGGWEGFIKHFGL